MFLTLGFVENTTLGRTPCSGLFSTIENDHPLVGNWANHRECHIAPDWLLIYQIHEDILVLELTRTSSHSDLFQ